MDTQETTAPDAVDNQDPQQDTRPAEDAREQVEAAFNHSEDSAPTADDQGAITATPETAADTPAELRVSETAEELTAEQLLISDSIQEPVSDSEVSRKLAVLEAIVYVTDEPLTVAQIANAMSEPADQVRKLLDRLVEEYNRPEHGLTVKEVAGGYKMSTKPEHHEAVRAFVKNLNPPLKLSLAALETLAVIAYKQPITAPEIMEIRGVQGAGVLKTLLDRKLITTAGRKQVVGKPILYKTTKEFLVQFGLKDLNELPTLKEFEDLRRMAMSEEELPLGAAEPAAGDEEQTASESAAKSEEPNSEEAQPAEASGAPQPEEPGEHAVAHEGGTGEE
jgi:segregation and condensation protein B